MAVDLGDQYPLGFTLKQGGVAVSSDTMTLTITLPDATTTVVTPVTPTDVGVYQHLYLTVQPGRHSARWVGTGANPGAYVEVFDVRPADLPYIVSLQDAKEQLNFARDEQQDEELRSYLEAATGAVENHLGQAVARRTFTEETTVGPAEPIILTWSPVISLVSVSAVDGSQTWDVDSLHASPAGVVRALTGGAPSGRLTVSYIAGMPIVPQNIAVATRIILQHLWETQRGTAGAKRPGGMGDTGGVQGMGYAIPNRAVELLGGSTPAVG